MIVLITDSMGQTVGDLFFIMFKVGDVLKIALFLFRVKPELIC